MPFNIGRALGGFFVGGPTGAIAGGMTGGHGGGQDPTIDPYGGNIQFDENGYPSRLPYGPHALDYQFLANKQMAQRQQALWGDVQGTMRQGLDLFQSYRPGGAAALASGMYGQSAGYLAQQALSTEAPDLLLGYRAQKQDEATKEAKRANRINQIVGGIKTIAGIAGGAAGGGAAGAAMGASAGFGGYETTPQGYGGYPSGAQQPQVGWQGDFPGSQGGPPTAGASLMPGGQGGPQAGGMAGAQAGFASQGAGPGGAMPGPAGPVPGGGPGPGEEPGNRHERISGGGGAGGPQIGPGGGVEGFGADGDFSSVRTAAAAMQGGQGILGPVVLEDWASNPVRISGTHFMVMSARSRLAAALAG